MVYKANSWSYDEALDELANDISKTFGQKLKPQIIVESSRAYNQMVFDCEKHNGFYENE